MSRPPRLPPPPSPKEVPCVPTPPPRRPSATQVGASPPPSHARPGSRMRRGGFVGHPPPHLLAVGPVVAQQQPRCAVAQERNRQNGSAVSAPAVRAHGQAWSGIEWDFPRVAKGNKATWLLDLQRVRGASAWPSMHAGPTGREARTPSAFYVLFFIPSTPYPIIVTTFPHLSHESRSFPMPMRRTINPSPGCSLV